MLSTWPGVRPKAMPLRSSGTILASSSRGEPLVDVGARVEARTGSGDCVSVLGPATFIQLGPDVGRVVSLHGEDAGGGGEVGLVADQRGGALEAGHSDVLEEECA